jgi:WD40 repeat protein
MSPNARFVLTRGAGTNAVLVADLSTGATPLLNVGPSVVDSAQFSHDSNRVVTASEDGLVRVFDAATASLVVSMPAGGGSVKQATFSTDGALVAGAGNDGRARIWNATSGIPSLLLAGHAAPLSYVAFNRDDTRLASSSSNGSTRVWRIESAPKIAVPPPVLDADVSPKHPDTVGVASTAAEGRAWLWTHGSHPVPLGSEPSSGIAFSRDGTEVATASRVSGLPPSASVWRAASPGAPLAHRVISVCPLGANGVQPPTTIFHQPSFSRDGRSVVLATNCGAVIWRWGRPPRIGSISKPFGGSNHSISVNAAAYSPDGEMIATGEYGRVRLWRVVKTPPGQTQPQLPVPLKGPNMGLRKTPVVVLGFNRTGRYVASGDSQGVIAIWSVKSHSEVRPSLNIPAVPTDVTFSPAGHRLLIAGSDGTVRVWDWKAGTILATLQLHAGATRVAQYVPGHPDEILSAGDDGLVEISKCPTCVSLPALERLAERHLGQFSLSP